MSHNYLYFYLYNTFFSGGDYCILYIVIYKRNEYKILFTEVIILLIILSLQLHRSALAQFICHLMVHPDSKQNNFNYFITGSLSGN